MAKQYKCPFCDRKYVIKAGLYNHMEDKHKLDLCGLPAAQVAFNYRNHYQLTKGNGKSVILGLPTKWNPATEKYERYANAEERKLAREKALKNMIGKYGKSTLLDDPEFQKKMLANRSISGKFKWSDGSETTYTGTFERTFLEHLVDEFDWANSSDVIGPAPMIINYTYDGKIKPHIPDFYIGSLNLIVNIKSKENKGYRLAAIDREIAEDEAIKKTQYNYIKIYDNDFRKFDELVRFLKENELNPLKQIYIV